MDLLAVIIAQLLDPIRLGMGVVAGLVLGLALTLAEERARTFLYVLGVIVAGVIVAYIVASLLPPRHFAIFLTGWIISSLEVWVVVALLRRYFAR